MHGPRTPAEPHVRADGRKERENADVDVSRSVLSTVGGHPARLPVGIVLIVAVAVGAGEMAGLSGAPALPAWVHYVPLAASLVLFGLPHGAVDHLAPARAAGTTPTRRWLLLVGAVYLTLASAYAVLWLLVPVAGAVLFIALTWFHWGQGDLYALDALGADHLDGRLVRLGTLLVRGGLPMVVPLLRFPERYRTVVDGWIALFGSGLEAAWLFSPTARGAVAVGFAALTAATLLAGRGRGSGRFWRCDAGETLLLWAYFLVVPPILAVGLYFCTWHSLRHIARLIAVDPASRARFQRDGAGAALLRTGREALPLSAVALAVLVGIGIRSGVDGDLGALAAFYLVFVSVLSLPHVAIVTWMDWAENAGVSRLVREQ